MFDVYTPTRFDLKWRMFGIPVRVHPLFWVLMLLLGPLEWGDPAVNLIWVVAAFASLMVHELGHALVALAFRWHPSILLYGFGGLTFHEAPYRAFGKRILLSFAGPAAGFLLAGLTYLTGTHLVEQGGEYGKVAVGFLLFINIVWNVINLFPVYPLDGGQIVRTLLSWLWHGKGERASMYISIVAACAVVGLAFWLRQPFLALMFGMMAYQEIMTLRQVRQERSATRYYYR